LATTLRDRPAIAVAAELSQSAITHGLEPRLKARAALFAARYFDGPIHRLHYRPRVARRQHDSGILKAPSVEVAALPTRQGHSRTNTRLEIRSLGCRVDGVRLDSTLEICGA